MVNGKLAWIIQEAPSLLVPLWCFFNGNENVTGSLANRILLAYFVGHYANRTVIFPLQIRGGKPTPFGVMLSALLFTSVNGIIQGRYLTQLHQYEDSHLTSPLFLIGSGLFLNGLLINLHSDAVLPPQAWRDRIQNSKRWYVFLHLRGKFLWGDYGMGGICHGHGLCVAGGYFCLRHSMQHRSSGSAAPSVVFNEV